jgi:hypothetical protein
MVIFFLKYWKQGLIALGIVAAIWFYKDWQFQKSENIRQTENARQLRLMDSIKSSSQLLSKTEIAEYLEYNNKELKKLLEESRIRENRIQSIMSNQYRYQDNTSKGYDISGLINAINQKKEFTVPFQDTTKCMTIGGNVTFKNDSLKVNITNREFKNKTDNVVYWERRQYKIFGIKTRFLGKKQFTAKTFDQCGESQIMKIEKKPKKT